MFLRMNLTKKAREGFTSTTGFALQIWCKETRTAVDKQVPLFSKDHERTFCLPVDKKQDQQCLNNNSSFHHEGLVPSFSQAELPLMSVQNVFFLFLPVSALPPVHFPCTTSQHTKSPKLIADGEARTP